LIYDKNLAKKPAYDSLIAAIKRHDPSSSSSSVVAQGSTTVALTAGQHILRFYIDAASFNIDWLQFTLNGSTPVRSISLNSFMGERQCQIMDLHGRQMAQFTIKAGTSLQESWSQKSNSLPKGVYLARLSAPGIAAQMVKLVRE